MPAVTSIANIALMHSGGGPVTGFEILLFLLVAGVVMLVAICWGVVGEWKTRTHGHNWPTVSAVVDVVSVAFIEDDTPGMKAYPDLSYNATLTYIYNNPEQQMGDYSRRFGKKEDAEAWANSYKGETLKVHVDPRDPTSSVLRGRRPLRDSERTPNSETTISQGARVGFSLPLASV